MPLGISLDQSVFQAGSKLKGSVYFDIHKEVSASSLVAVLTGREHTQIEYDTGTGDERREQTVRSSRPLVSINIPLDNHMIQYGKVRPGKYQMPFEIDLPDGLPSSMKASGRNYSDRCAIEYELKAQLKGSGWISDYKCFQPVTIVAKPLQAEPAPYLGEPVQRGVKFCCCLNRGHILFGASVQNTLLDKGETVQIALSCKNRTSVEVHSVRAELLERLTWTAQTRHEYLNTTLATVQIPAFTGLERSASFSVPQLHDDLESIRRDLEQATHAGSITMPQTANDTFAGKLIQCRHFIRVTVDTGCCIDNPTLEIPVQAGPAPLEGRPSTYTAPPPSAPADFADGATIVSSPVVVSSSSAMVGGAATSSSGGDEEEQEVVVPSYLAPPPPSVESLMKDLNDSISDYDLIKKRVGDPDWKPVFEKLTPAQYGSIIKNVDLDFDQPKVATEMAPVIGSKFTCDYCVAAVRSASEWNRSSIVEKIVHHCVDLPQNKGKILAELSDWEKQVTQRAFNNALKGK